MTDIQHMDALGATLLKSTGQVCAPKLHAYQLQETEMSQSTKRTCMFRKHIVVATQVTMENTSFS